MKSINDLYQYLEDQFGSNRFGLHSYGYTQGMAIAKLIEAEVEQLESTVLRMYREHPIAQFEQWIEDLGLNEADAWKPRTLEDVLRDVWKEALDYAKSDMWRNPDEVFTERADEIRELLGDDAE